MNNTEVNGVTSEIASLKSEIETLKSVIKCSLEQTQKSYMDFGELLLSAIEDKEELSVIDFLVSLGANVNYNYNSNRTPLYYAIVNHQYDVVEYLIDHEDITNKVTTDTLNYIKNSGQYSKKMTAFIDGLL